MVISKRRRAEAEMRRLKVRGRVKCRGNKNEGIRKLA